MEPLAELRLADPCPDREPIIGIPFYLADPKLAALEQAVNDIEDEREIMMYLRHEAGHAFNYAYELYATREWHELFGPFDRAYSDDYKPVPFSRGFVRHIAGWYAQKHPDEDFAETFAVWLTPRLNWRRRYQGWAALAKLEYVDRTAKALGEKDPRRSVGKAELPVDEMQATIEDFYRERTPDETQAVADLPLDVDRCGDARPAHHPCGRMVHRQLLRHRGASRRRTAARRRRRRSHPSRPCWS